MAFDIITEEVFSLLTSTQEVARGEGVPAGWQVVETHLQDETHWCDIEGKWEYHYTQRLLIAAVSEIKGLQRLIELDEVQDELEGHRVR